MSSQGAAHPEDLIGKEILTAYGRTPLDYSFLARLPKHPPNESDKFRNLSSPEQTRQLFFYLMKNSIRDIGVIFCSALFSRVKAEKVAEFLSSKHEAELLGHEEEHLRKVHPNISGDMLRLLVMTIWSSQHRTNNSFRRLNSPESGLDPRVFTSVEEFIQFSGVWPSLPNIERDSKGIVVSQWGESLAAEEAAEAKAKQKAAGEAFKAQMAIDRGQSSK